MTGTHTEEKKQEKFIRFVLIERKPKTNVYNVVSTYNGVVLGQVKWFPSWRRYAFFAGVEMIFDSGCLGEIKEFIDYISEDHKLKKEKEQRLMGRLGIKNVQNEDIDKKGQPGSTVSKDDLFVTDKTIKRLEKE